MSAHSVSSRASGREPWIIAAYFAGTVVLGAALAPWLYHLAQGSAAWIEARGWSEAPVLGWLQHHVGKADFTRVFNRAMLVSALVCLWPAARALQLRRGGLSLEKNGARGRDLAAGFVIAAALLLAMGWVYFQQGLFLPNKKAQLGPVLQDSLVRAVGAGLMEELFFRGALLGLVMRAWSARTALVFVTTVFAAVHFLQAPPALVIRSGVEAGTGFWLVGTILRTFGDANFLLAEFATLWLAGFILGVARLRTKSLWLPFGIHAGWIFGIGLYAGLVKASKAVARDEWLPWVGVTLKSGLVPLGVLALTGAALWAYMAMGRGRSAARA